ncbi:hypothetical protein [Gaopeijia maritima]|uniref:hypothetical protein n=1 Tax=Gaopeijia maritima TaxID=3119007 RepID=UPI00328D0352
MVKLSALVAVTYLCYGCRGTTTFRFSKGQRIRQSMVFTCHRCNGYHRHARFTRRPLTGGSDA